MKGRRLEPWFVANCNGDGARVGCGFHVESRYAGQVREQSERHAIEAAHEVVVTNVNDGLVLDGRPKRRVTRTQAARR